MRLIDADALSDKLENMWRIPLDWDGSIKQECEDAFAAIDDAPTIDAAPVVHGYWDFLIDAYYCSECDCKLRKRKRLPKYCEHCGAKMDGKKGASA